MDIIKVTYDIYELKLVVNVRILCNEIIFLNSTFDRIKSGRPKKKKLLEYLKVNYSY